LVYLHIFFVFELVSRMGQTIRWTGNDGHVP